MEFGDIEARKRSKRRSKRRDTDGIEEEDYSEEESFANIDSHLERQSKLNNSPKQGDKKLVEEVSPEQIGVTLEKKRQSGGRQSIEKSDVKQDNKDGKGTKKSTK